MKKILHFEDDQEFFGAMYRAKAELEGFVYKGYEHPPAAPNKLIELVLIESPDIIIMDIIMPVMDGFRATEIIKGDTQTKNIPLCFLTNIGQQEDIERGIALGAAKYFIMAQFTPNELFTEIRKILGMPFTEEARGSVSKNSWHGPSFFDLPMDSPKGSTFNKEKARECVCTNGKCAKCLLINCNNENCAVHTMKAKKDFRALYKNR